MFGSVEEARSRARKRLPAAVFHYIDGGKEAEQATVANEAAFARHTFLPAVCPTATAPKLGTDLFGRPSGMPLAIAPTGFVRIVHPDGELGAARAAASESVPIVLSTWSSVPLADAVAANPETWFQLYMIGGREGARYCIDMAREAGCRVLVVTADIAGVAPSDRVAPALPETSGLAAALRFAPSALSRPGWLLALLKGGLAMPAPNAPRRFDGTMLRVQDAGRLLTRTPFGWDDLRWLRRQWQGPLVLKGIMRAADAERAVACGADGIVVSNHGGKVLDSTPGTLDVLPAIADAVAGRCEIMVDGGARRGADIVKARALGAQGVLIGRPYLWGLACGGQQGVERVLRLFRQSLSATLANLDLDDIARVGPDTLWAGAAQPPQ